MTSQIVAILKEWNLTVNDKKQLRNIKNSSPKLGKGKMEILWAMHFLITFYSEGL